MTVSAVKPFLNEFVAYSHLGEITQNMEFHLTHTMHNGTTSFYRDGIWLNEGAYIVNDWLAGEGHELRPNQARFNGTDVFLTRGILTVSIQLTFKLSIQVAI